jgi:SAM-dependent methyltransferase
VYKEFKALYKQHRGRPLRATDSILDFGCGWGRVIRFFLKDVHPHNLLGVDISTVALEACSQTNRWCRFAETPTLPPSNLPADSFDLIYAYSVFSHLSEEAHLAWLKEFQRLSKPNGVILLTTLSRGFLESAQELAGGDPNALQAWQQQAATFFSPAEEWLEMYDRGKFCYMPINRTKNPHFGLACIPEAYVRSVWSTILNVMDYLPPKHGRSQDLIACINR